MSKAFLIRRTSALLVSEKGILHHSSKRKENAKMDILKTAHVAHLSTSHAYGNHIAHHVPIILFQYISKLT